MPLTQTAERRIPAVEVLEPRARDSWTHTRNGDPRGYIDSDRLNELWIHTGTACNLACPFCLEGSHPGDGRIPGMPCQEGRNRRRRSRRYRNASSGSSGRHSAAEAD